MSYTSDDSYAGDVESLGECGVPGSHFHTNEKNKSGLQSIWHHKHPAKHVLKRLRTDAARGLSLHDAEKRLLKCGPNRLSPPMQKPWWKKFLVHFTDFFSLMLQFAALMCLVAYATEPTDPMHLYLGVFLYAVVIVTSLFSYIQQHKSDKTLKEFQNFLPPRAIVRRDGGATHEIDAAELVVGDIVQVKIGDKIPADMRILYSNRFTVDNSSLTGESEPVELQAEMTSEAPLETRNLAFFGCSAVDGSCTGVVISTGDRTVFGEIANLTYADDGGAVATTLHNDIHHFVVSISVFAFSVGVFFFVVGMIKRRPFVHNLVYSIGIIVSNIPEGLLATVTVSLTASARRMSRKNVLVKQLDAVESLGSTTVICSDKTGTLTQNKMNVSHLAYGGKVEVVHSDWVSSKAAEGSLAVGGEGLAGCLEALIYGTTVCSTAVFDEADASGSPEMNIADRPVCGDASEAGILRFTEKIHPSKEFREQHKLVATIPFNSKTKYMATAHKCPDSDVVLRVVVKGAAERVLERCTDLFSKDGVRNLTERDRTLLERQMVHLAGRGERVFGYAEKFLPPQKSAPVLDATNSRSAMDSIPTTDLCFIGFVSLIDPPRDTVPQAVETCREAGIRVIMVTGDHHETARSIAQQVGIITKPVSGDGESADECAANSAIVVKGPEIVEASQKKWDEILGYSEIVFARTSPHQKLQIVEQLQALDEVVTVTGDGCNDAPALRQANTGVAMGLSGSDVSREAADIVLLDDNFSSIVGGVEEGRLIFDNLKKSIAYTLTSNVPQLVPFLAFLILQIPLPLTTVLILCIDLGTDIFPAIALAYEKPETDIMKRPPRNAKKDRLMNNMLLSYSTLQLGIIQTAAGFFAYLVILNDYGLAPGTLLGLSTDGHFASERSANQRWLITSQTKSDGLGHEAIWFKKTNPKFAKYFIAERPGFVQQTEERFSALPATERSPSQSDNAATRADPAQFQNMIKIIGFETQQPPCTSFICEKGAQSVTNDFACFDPRLNSGPVTLSGARTGKRNNNVTEGRGNGQGCFDLWTPYREREVLQRAQTGFFAAVVVAQVFTILSCKTRILSFIQTGIQNSALVISLVLEFIVAMVLVYFPLLRAGFDVRPLKLAHWLPGVPFGLFILFYDECRKWFIRRHIMNESGQIIPAEGKVDKVAAWVHDWTLW